MKRFKVSLMAAIMVIGLMSFVGYNILTPVNARAEEKKDAAKEEQAAKETKKATPKAKKAAVKRENAVVAVSPQLSELDPKTTIDIMGSGFLPDEEVRILFTDAVGTKNDIGDYVKPELKANQSGAFLTSFDCSAFIRDKRITPGAFELVVTDKERKPLAKAYVYFKAAKKAAPARPAAAPAKGDSADKGEKKADAAKGGGAAKGEKKAE